MSARNFQSLFKANFKSYFSELDSFNFSFSFQISSLKQSGCQRSFKATSSKSSSLLTPDPFFSLPISTFKYFTSHSLKSSYHFISTRSSAKDSRSLLAKSQLLILVKSLNLSKSDISFSTKSLYLALTALGYTNSFYFLFIFSKNCSASYRFQLADQGFSSSIIHPQGITLEA